MCQSFQSLNKDPIRGLYAGAEKIGFGVQLHQFVAVVLSCLSASARRIFHVHLTGPAGTGKSTVVQGAGRILGPHHVVTSGAILRLTAPAAARMNDRLSGKGLLLDERVPDAELEALLRMAASGVTAVRTITIRGQAVDLVIDPRFSITEAMLDDKQLNQQDRSRYLRLSMPVDRASREQISALSRRRYTVDGLRRGESVAAFATTFQEYLGRLSKEISVVVPFASKIRLDTRSQNRDRLVNQILAATCTVAWLRQLQRQLVRDEEVGTYVCATPQDYEVVHTIVTAVGDDGEDEQLSDNAIKLFRLWSSWAKMNKQGLRRADIELIAEGRLSRWQVYRALVELAKVGYAAGPSGCGQRGDWRLTDFGSNAQHPNLFQMLPTPNQVARAAQDSNPSLENDLPLVSSGNCRVALTEGTRP